MASEPAIIATNRYGLSFVRSRTRRTYRSGRAVRSYYTHACTRCGWAFKPPRHLAHRLDNCDMVLADPEMKSWARRNLPRELR